MYDDGTIHTKPLIKQHRIPLLVIGIVLCGNDIYDEEKISFGFGCEAIFEALSNSLQEADSFGSIDFDVNVPII